MAEPERLEPMEPPFSLLRRQLPSREAKCGTKMVSIILCAPTVGCVTSLCPPQTPNSSLLTSKAIPHNSKCRYGERGTADAKPKAGCFIEHFGNADAVPQPPERCLSRKAGIMRCCHRFYLKMRSRGRTCPARRFPGIGRLRGSAGPGVPGPYVRSVWFTRAPVGISLPGRPRSQRFLTPP